MRKAMLCALALTACGRPDMDRPESVFDSQLKVYMDEFFAEAADYGLTSGKPVWALEFGQPAQEEWIGECRVMTYQHTSYLGSTSTVFRTIVIKPEMMPLLTKTVVYHELGHCAYDLPHELTNESALMYPMAPHLESEAELRQITVEMFDTVSSAYSQRR